MSTPSVYFVCVRNGGKSQMAAALARARAGDRVEVHSAGTDPGDGLNEESAASVAEVGASMDGATPTPVDGELLRHVDRVVLIGDEAELEAPPDMRGTLERWSTDEPSERGIEGMARMRMIRDELAERVDGLLAEMTAGA